MAPRRKAPRVMSKLSTVTFAEETPPHLIIQAEEQDAILFEVTDTGLGTAKKRPFQHSSKLPISIAYKHSTKKARVVGPPEVGYFPKAARMKSKIPGPSVQTNGVSVRVAYTLAYRRTRSRQIYYDIALPTPSIMGSLVNVNIRTVVAGSSKQEKAPIATSIAFPAAPKYTSMIPITQDQPHELSSKEQASFSTEDGPAKPEVTDGRKSDFIFKIVDAGTGGGTLDWPNKNEISLIISTLIMTIGVTNFRSLVDLYGFDLDMLLSKKIDSGSTWIQVQKIVISMGWEIGYVRFNRIHLYLGLNELEYLPKIAITKRNGRRSRVRSTLERVMAAPLKKQPRIKALTSHPKPVKEVVQWKDTCFTTTAEWAWEDATDCGFYIDEDFDIIQSDRKRYPADYLKFMREVHGVQIGWYILLAMKEENWKFVSKQGDKYDLLEERMKIQRYKPFTGFDQ